MSCPGDGCVVMRESKIESYLVRRVTEAGGLCWKWSSPSRRGVPDRIVIISGRVLFVELKATGLKPTAQQLHVHQAMALRGAEVYVVDSHESVDQFVGELTQ